MGANSKRGREDEVTVLYTKDMKFIGTIIVGQLSVRNLTRTLISTN